MHSERWTFVSDPRLDAARAIYLDRVAAVDSQLTPGLFPVALTPQVRALLHLGARHVGADELSVWILDETREALVVVFNSGPKAEGFVGFRQPLTRGIVSMVVRSEQPFADNAVRSNTSHDKTVDNSLAQRTDAMLVCPFYAAGRIRGVISAVRLSGPDSSIKGANDGFDASALETWITVAELCGQLLDAQIYRKAWGDVE